MSTSILPSLSSLPSHSIFLPPAASTSTLPDEEWELVDSPSDPTVGQKTCRMIMRDKDLLVAVGKEIRMTGLSGEAWQVRDGLVGTYKTLKSPHLGFTIQSLVLSPSGRRLAAAGRNQIAVLVLPKTGVIGTTTGEVACKSLVIDEFQFSPSSSSIITKVDWHPWGEGGDSLWVLTSDGKLREYDLQHPDDPTQTFSFLPNSGPSTRSRFTAIDPLSRHATSFAFVPTTDDFGASMVYVLAANGDIYLMGPILPFKTEVSLKWLQSAKINADREGGLIMQWVDDLVKQAKQDEYRRKKEQEELTTPSRRTSLLRSGRRAGSEAPSETSRQTSDGMILLHPPHLTASGGPAPGVHRPLALQGPVVLSPGPELGGEDDDEDENAATDLAVFEGGGKGELVIAVAWARGRVDVSLAVDRPLPRWVSSRDKSSTLPTIAILESILLPLPTHGDSALTSNAPSFLFDPLHGDTIYIKHAFGVECISVKNTLDSLRNGTELAACDVVWVVESVSTPSKPITGALVLCNIIFGYALIALASTHQLAAVELDFRVADTNLNNPPSPTKPEIPSKTDARSLILARPLDINKLVASVRGQTDLNSAARSISHGAPMSTVSAGQLRSIGDIISQLQSRTRAVRAASQVVENHLNLCVQEFQRQLRVLKECRYRIEGLRDSKAIAKAHRMLDTQLEMGGRWDKVLVAMAAEYRPEVGEVERRWFEELDRLRIRVQGGKSSAAAGLTARIQTLQEQLKAIQPSLQTSTQSPMSSFPDAPAEKGYGTKQLKPLEAALGQRSEEIRKLMKRMETLSIRVESVAAAESQDDE